MTQQQNQQSPCVLSDAQIDKCIERSEVWLSNKEIALNIIQANDEARREAGWLVEPPRPIEEAPRDGSVIYGQFKDGPESFNQETKWVEPYGWCDLSRGVEQINGKLISFYNLPSGQITPNNTDNLGILTEGEE